MSAYPIPVFHFQVEWGQESIGFAEVTWLTIESQPIECRGGSDKDFAPVMMPGLVKYSSITLKRGVIPDDSGFYKWLGMISLNQVERRDIIILLLNEKREPVMTWSVENAWPVKVEGPLLKSTGNEVAIESIELSHEGLRLVTNEEGGHIKLHAASWILLSC